MKCSDCGRETPATMSYRCKPCDRLASMETALTVLMKAVCAAYGGINLQQLREIIADEASKRNLQSKYE